MPNQQVALRVFQLVFLFIDYKKVWGSEVIGLIGKVKVSTKYHPSISYWDISIWTNLVDKPTFTARGCENGNLWIQNVNQTIRNILAVLIIICNHVFLFRWFLIDVQSHVHSALPLSSVWPTASAPVSSPFADSCRERFICFHQQRARVGDVLMAAQRSHGNTIIKCRKIKVVPKCPGEKDIGADWSTWIKHEHLWGCFLYAFKDLGSWCAFNLNYNPESDV